MDNTVTCICHVDMDGFASAAIVRRRHPGCQIIYANYGRDIPLWKIQAGSTIYVVDFSLLYEEFVKLQSQGFNIIWIDHHINNYSTIEGKGFTCAGIRDDSHCGAYLTWKYLFPNEEIPHAINLVNDYDLWQFKYETTLAFSYGMGIFDTRPTSPSGCIWQELLNKNTTKLTQIIELGKPIQQYTELRNKISCEDLAYIVHVNQKPIWFANIKQTNSMFFDSVDKSKVDGVMLGQWFSDVGKYRCSVYSPDNIKEVYEIAASFGGGGHPKASGFTSSELPVARPETKDQKDINTVVNKYCELSKLADKSSIVKQCCAKAASITLKANAFFSSLDDTPCIAINHPYLPDVFPIIPYCFDVVNQATGTIAKIAISFVLDNTNRYRVCVKPLDSSVDVLINSKIYQSIKAQTDGSITEINGYLWYYTKELPVKLCQQIKLYY